MTHIVSAFALVASLVPAGEATSVLDHVAGGRSGAAGAGGTHDFHVSYGRMAVEGSSIAVRFRFFADDLETTIRVFTSDDDAVITDDPASWEPFESYLADAFLLIADGDTLGAAIIGSGEDVMNKEPVRWFLLQYTAADTVRAVDLVNRLLFNTFDDQKNIVQFRHFPSGKSGSLYFTHDRPMYDLQF